MSVFGVCKQTGMAWATNGVATALYDEAIEIDRRSRETTTKDNTDRELGVRFPSKLMTTRQFLSIQKDYGELRIAASSPRWDSHASLPAPYLKAGSVMM